MMRRILTRVSLIGSFLAAATFAHAAQTQILGVGFSKTSSEERLTLPYTGPAPAFRETADQEGMRACIEFAGVRLAGPMLAKKLPESQYLQGVIAEQVEASGDEIVRVTIRFNAWAPYSVQDENGSIIVALATAPSGAASSVAAMQTSLSTQQDTSAAVGKALAYISSRPGVDYPEAIEGATARRIDKPEDFGLQGGVFDSVVNFDFVDQPVDLVIRALSAKAKGKLNILINPAVTAGKSITIRFENVKLGVALDQILRSNGLAYIQADDDILRIVDEADVGRTTVEVDREVIVLNWVKAEDLQKSLQPFISTDGQIQANPETNSIIITETPPNLQEMRRLVQELDLPEKQVMIEMHLVDVLKDSSKAHGVDWRAISTDSSGLAGIGDGDLRIPTGDSAFFDSGLPLSEASTLFTFGDKMNIFGEEFRVSLNVQANATKNYAEVLANPRVITLNNLEASIRIQEQIPYLQGTTENQQGNVSETVEWKEAGEEIIVTPTITSSGYIRMEINVLQEIFRGRQGVGALAPPRIDERESTTNVIVQDGSTILLGGLAGHRFLEDRAGTPWFMEVPFARWLFQSEKSSIAKSTLYLFVRPTIVPVDASQITENEKYWFDATARNANVPDMYFDDWGDSDVK
jgi:type IV pilus assembly protein PilQ